MNILTDCPEELNCFCKGMSSWKQVGPPHGMWNDLWDVMSDNAAFWTSKIPLEDTCCGVPCLVVINYAARSQFDAFIKALNGNRSLPPGAAAIAFEGKFFHGLHGRSWEALRGNIHLSVYFPFLIDADDTSRSALTMLPSIAVVDTIQEIFGKSIELGIKWVNDVLVDGKKIAGVLTHTQLKGSSFHSVIFGIGLNVEVIPVITPTVFVPDVTCLNAINGVDNIRVMDVLWVLLKALNRRFRMFLSEGYTPILEAYRKYSIVLGRDVRIWKDSCESLLDFPTAENLLAMGTVDAIEDDLALRIRGKNTLVRTGRLAFEESYRLFGCN